jgi:PIN domain nuclease of toxin-antitoxin system
VGIRLLLDTHALVWWWTDDPRLPATARAAIAAPENTVFVSAATGWEIATKFRIGKWPEVELLVRDFEALLRRSRFASLPMTAAHSLLAGSLAGQHRDPFDRMLAAQATQESLIVVSGDAVFASYNVNVIWEDTETLARS